MKAREAFSTKHKGHFDFDYAPTAAPTKHRDDLPRFNRYQTRPPLQGTFHH